MHWVIGDVHGCFREMMSMIKRIEANDDSPIIYFLGDFIDRGPQVWDVLDFMMNNITPNGRYRCLLGNHEAYIIEWYEKWLLWYKNQTYDMPETMFDFSKWLDAADYLYPLKLEKIIHFFKSLPLETVLNIKTVNGKNIRFHLAHAWPSFGRQFTNEYEYKTVVLSSRSLQHNIYNSDIAVVGHTPTPCYRSSRPGMIDYLENVINVDGGVVFQNANKYYPCLLCGICLENLEEIYSDSIDNRLIETNRNLSKSEVDLIIKKYKEKYMKVESEYRLKLLKQI